MEVFFLTLAKVFTPIAWVSLAWYVLLVAIAVHLGADLALQMWLRNSRRELQQIVGQYQPDYIPYQAIWLHRTIRVSRPAVFYPLLVMLLMMILACTLMFPLIISSYAVDPLKQNAVTVQFDRAWLNPFTGKVSIRGIATTRTNHDESDFDLKIAACDFDVRLTSMDDPIHRFDQIAVRGVSGSYLLKDSPAKSIGGKDTLVIDELTVDDLAVHFVDRSLHPLAAGMPRPEMPFDVVTTKLVAGPIRTANLQFDLMTRTNSTGSIDGQSATCETHPQNGGSIVTLKYTNIDLSKFKHYFKSTMPQIASGAMDLTITQKIQDKEPVVQFVSEYSLHDIKIQSVNRAMIANPKTFVQISAFLTKHSSDLRLIGAFDVNRKTYEEAPSYYASGVPGLQRKALEADLMSKLVKETDMGLTPGGEQIQDMKTLVDNSPAATTQKTP